MVRFVHEWSSRVVNTARPAYQSLAASPVVRWLGVWGRYLLLFGVLGLLVYRLSGVDWREVIASLPTRPLFYAICVLMAVNQPLFYAMAFRVSWPFQFYQGFAAVFRMCVYNNDVFGSSGEMYLFVWAKRKFGLSHLSALRTIKDNTILHCACDHTVTFCAPALLLHAHLLHLGPTLEPVLGPVLTWAPLAGAACWAVLVVFRHRLFSWSDGQFVRVCAAHAMRLLTMNLLLIIQWSTVFPGYPWENWCTLLVLRNFINGIPMLPANDLLFVGAGMELGEHLGIGAAPLAGMLLMTSVVSKVINVLLLSAATALELDGQRREASGLELPVSSAGD